MLQRDWATKVFLAAALFTTLSFGSAWAAPVLKITEVYEGVPGEDVTEDWIEITNFGDMTFTFGVDGDLYFDDGSGDPTENEQVFGITDLTPGESAIVVLGNAASDAVDFFNAWGGGANLSGVELGYLDGDDAPGLGQGGEDVYLFDGNTAGANVVDTVNYLGNDNGGAVGSTWVWDVAEGSFDGDTWAVDGVWGAFTAPTAAGDDGEFPLVGSPGAVPEPSTLVLFGAAAILSIRRRNR